MIRFLRGRLINHDTPPNASLYPIETLFAPVGGALALYRSNAHQNKGGKLDKVDREIQMVFVEGESSCRMGVGSATRTIGLARRFPFLRFTLPVFPGFSLKSILPSLPNRAHLP